MDLSPDLLAMGLVWFVVFLFSTTLHEAAHAFVALRLGDPTAYLGGQVTLNPLPHVQREPLGTIVVPIASFVMTGGAWMMGWASAPYDPWWADRYPRRAAWMALAGPMSNLLLVGIAGLTMRIGLAAGFFTSPDQITFTQVVAGKETFAGLATLVSILFTLNLLLFIFNLLPFPPLDGSAVLPLVMKESLAQRYLELMRQPMWSLIGIVAAWRVLEVVFAPILLIALGLVYAGHG